MLPLARKYLLFTVCFKLRRRVYFNVVIHFTLNLLHVLVIKYYQSINAYEQHESLHVRFTEETYARNEYINNNEIDILYSIFAELNNYKGCFEFGYLGGWVLNASDIKECLLDGRMFNYR